MIDWRLANNVAGAIAGMQPAPPSSAFEHVAGPAEESAHLVSAYTGLQALAGPLPHAEPVGRAVWIESNLASLKTVLDPVAGRLGQGMGPLGPAVSTAAGVVIALEVGAISGLLAQRVMGQYEFAILDPKAPARLLFVSPNLARAAGTLEAESDELLRWVALHEVTHALQFGGVPWLREHLAGMVTELLAALDVDPRRMMRLPDAADLKALLEMAREGDLTTLVVGPERRSLLDRMQAFMAVLEGYAEHVMDAVGEDLLPNLPHLREALDRRRRDRSGLLRVLERLLGLELKMRQYQQGKAFCDAVVTAGGIAALNRVWDGPDRLPTMAEIDDPAGWLARTTAQAA
jgi:coenzyme F420 biosynthesis associated uncharacterized protein